MCEELGMPEFVINDNPWDMRPTLSLRVKHKADLLEGKYMHQDLLILFCAVLILSLRTGMSVFIFHLFLLDVFLYYEANLFKC